MNLFNFNTICNLAAGVLAAGLLAYLVRLLIGRSTRGVPRCLRCDYNMTGHAGAATPACPECGRVHRRVRQLYKRRRSRRRLAVVVVLLLLLPGTLAYAPRVRQRMYESRETFTQAVTPTTLYCLCLPWLDDRGRSVINRRGTTIYTAPNLYGPTSGPIFPLMDFAEFWPFQRDLLIWQCGRLYRQSPNDPRARALAMKWIEACPRSRFLDWDAVLLALREPDHVIRWTAGRIVQPEIRFDGPIRHDSAFRAAVVQACITEIRDPNAKLYGLLGLTVDVCQAFGQDALPLARPLLELSATLTPEQLRGSMMYCHLSTPTTSPPSPASFCLGCVAMIGPAAWEPIAQFIESTPALAAEHRGLCFKAIERCFIDSPNGITYRLAILDEQATRCLAWLDQRAAAADPQATYNEAQELATKLRIARELMRMQPRVTVDEVDARWRQQADEN